MDEIPNNKKIVKITTKKSSVSTIVAYSFIIVCAAVSLVICWGVIMM